MRSSAAGCCSANATTCSSLSMTSFLEETRPEEDGQWEQEGRDDDVPGQFLDIQADLSAVYDAGSQGGHGALDDECAADVASDGQDECQGQRHRRYEGELDCRWNERAPVQVQVHVEPTAN